MDIELTEKINDDAEKLLKKYKDIPITTLSKELGINVNAKNHLNLMIKRLVSYSNVLSFMKDEENVAIKTIKLDKYGKLKESMSLPSFKYCDLVNEDWVDSTLRNYFNNQTFVFTVFKKDNKELFFDKIIVWEMPEIILEEGVRPVWEKMKECLLTGNIVKYIDDYGRYISFFPSASENAYVHVRPHAQNRNDTYPLPFPDKLTGLVVYPKHSFWLNRSYILKIIKKES